MVANMPDGVLVIDQTGEMSVINPVAQKLLFTEDLGDENSPHKVLLRKLGFDPRMILQQSGANYVRKEILLNGLLFQVEIAAVVGEQRKEIGCVVTLRDISAEREIDKLKSQFLSIISHELKTPIGVVKSALQNILDGVVGELKPEQREMIDIANCGLESLALVVENLLDLNRILTGRFTIKKTHVDLRDILTKSMSRLEELMAKKDVSIEVKLPDTLPLLYADRDKLEKVFYYLLQNALKFNKDHGRVTVHAKVSSHEYQISISDTGIGIPKAAQYWIFSKFRQIEEPLTRQQNGIGLGLSLAKGFIEAQGGRIWLVSEIGKGSTFYFTLPVPKEESEEFVTEKEGDK